MNATILVLFMLALAITLGVLFAGLFVMARGGEVNRKYGNKLMRARVIAQGIAVLLFAAAMLVGGD